TYGNGIGFSVDGGRTFEIRDTGVAGGKDICLTREGPLWQFDSNGVLESSITGGLSWNPTPSPQIALTIFNNYDGASSDGRRFWYAATDSSVITTANYGVSWDTLQLPLNSYLVWVDTEHGANLVRGVALFITRDGGRTWDTVVTKHSAQPQVVLGGGALQGYPAPGVLVVTGGEGTTDFSTDTGHTWMFTRFLNLSNINILRDSLWYATGLSSPPNSVIALFRSTDRGISWNQVNYTCPNGPGTLAFGDALHGIALGTALTEDGGYTWDCLDTSIYATGPPAMYPSGFDASAYYDVTQWFGVKYICLSTDRGSTWSALFPQPSGSPDFLPVGHHLFFVFPNELIWTNDNGITFDTLSFNYTGSLAGFIKRAPDGTLWAGDDLDLYVSRDNGNSWVSQSENVPYSQDSFQLTYTFLPVDSITGFVKTSDGGILRTTDAGVSWQQDFILPTLIIDSRHWYHEMLISGHVGTYTSDAGTTWNVVPITPGGYNGGMFFAVDSVRWLLGDYYTTNAGATWVPIPGWNAANGINFTVVDSSTAFGGQLWRLDMPWYIKPQQSVTSAPMTAEPPPAASPNPTSESTTLSFTTPSAGTVKIELFDVLGNKVTGGFSEILGAGNHTHPVSLAGLPAGIYYARIATSSGIQTIKLAKE
ncbi:MAG TPA: T9SS type A sorting domain-containing protein, partial [Candidatus Kapabacteria bacterium]|nr:T9SS type A sorting domain-containing protein [Candidatus Kapabacteria bacterium]